jgi:hypothetical protein
MPFSDDAGIQVSNAQARFILEIPGYELFKPIEVALFEREGAEARFMAQHFLPLRNNNGKGWALVGYGRTGDSATLEIVKQLDMYYRNSTDELERSYLRSIMRACSE